MTSPNEARLLLGWRKSNATPALEPIWSEREGHIATIAPTGGGKGVSCVIPALLNWSGPAIVVDPKGEAYAVTARYRHQIGQKVLLLDPFGVTGDPTGCLNPLQTTNINSPTLADDAAALANLLCEGVRHSDDPFWDDRANALITGLIIYLLKDNDGSEPYSLSTVRKYIHAEQDVRMMLRGALAHHPDPEVRAAGAIFSLNSKTLGCILSTAQSHLSFLRAGPVQYTIDHNTIHLGEIQSGEPLTLYLVIPPDKLISHGRLLRLWLGNILNTLSQRHTAPEQPTLLLIDEAAQLGRLDPLLTAVTLLRGYGVKVWSFWQDLSQLTALYPDDWPTLLNNCATQQFFAPASPSAADLIHTYLANTQPASLLTLKDDQQVLSQSGQMPRITRRPNYLTDAMFQGRFDANPFYAHTSHAIALCETSDNVFNFAEARARFEPPYRL